MKAITIKPQHRLGFSRTFLMTVRGVRYRLFRSIVTVVVITVAIAFLMNIVTESLIKRTLAENSRQRVQELREGLFWFTRLTAPAGEDEILAGLAAAAPGDPLFREAMNFGKLDEASTKALAEKSALAIRLLHFFEGVDYGRRRLLVGRAWGLETFDLLQNPEAFGVFKSRLKEMRSVRFPISEDEFEHFLREWPAQKASLSAIQDGWAGAIQSVNAFSGEASLLHSLTDAKGAFGNTVRAAGFVLSSTTAARISEQAHRILVMKELERAIDTPSLKQEIAAKLNILPREVTLPTIWRLLEDRNSAEWLANQLKAAQLNFEFTREDLVAMSDTRNEEKRLAKAEGLVQTGGGLFGLGERMGWLVLVSLGVCVVGITNAMFMSVTERYREIATMKCLGALDGTIMLIFVLEAALLGLSGGAVGALLGALVAIGRLFLGFGTLVAGSMPLGEILVALLIAAFIGVLLAAIGAVFPSYKAARLAPMEAMRIE